MKRLHCTRARGIMLLRIMVDSKLTQEGPVFKFLLQIAARLRQQPPFFGAPPSGLPPDPYAPVRHPRSRRPGDRSAAAAVEEPDTEKIVQAVGAGRGSA